MFLIFQWWIVMKSIFTYTMSCFKLPLSLCNELQSLMAKFWWGYDLDKKSIHWIAWDKLSKPKALGGLGLRNLTSFNLAFVSKQCWRIWVVIVWWQRFCKISTFLVVICSMHPHLAFILFFGEASCWGKSYARLVWSGELGMVSLCTSMGIVGCLILL